MAKQLGEALRGQLLDGNAPLPNNQLLNLLAKLVEVPSSGNPRANLEVALLDTALAGAPKPSKPMPAAVAPKPTVQVDPKPTIKQGQSEGAATSDFGDSTEAEPGAGAGSSNLGESAVAEPASQSFEARPTAEAQKLTPARERSPEADMPDGSPQMEPKEPSSEPTDSALDAASWPEILSALKKHHNTLYGIIKTVRPHFEPGQLTLECSATFYQKKLSEKTSQEKLANIIQTVTGHKVQIKSIVGEALSPDEAVHVPPTLPPAEEKVHTVAAPKPASPEVTTISNIFGGAEVLES
jgi:hypothetical protein